MQRVSVPQTLWILQFDNTIYTHIHSIKGRSWQVLADFIIIYYNICFKARVGLFGNPARVSQIGWACNRPSTATKQCCFSSEHLLYWLTLREFQQKCFLNKWPSLAFSCCRSCRLWVRSISWINTTCVIVAVKVLTNAVLALNTRGSPCSSLNRMQHNVQTVGWSRLRSAKAAIF